MIDDVACVDICAHCGVCCTGAMFSYVPFVAPDDSTKLVRNGYPAGLAGDEGLPLPCHFQEGALCTIYNDRPHICSAYRCLVLERAQEGKLPVEQAVTLAGELAKRFRQLRSLMKAEETLPQMRRRVEDMRQAGQPIAQKDAELMLAYYAFNLYLDRNFRRPRERHVKYTGEV